MSPFIPEEGRLREVTQCSRDPLTERLEGRVVDVPSRIDEIYDPSLTRVYCGFRDLENPWFM